MKTNAIPHTYWMRAGLLRKALRVSYIELYQSDAFERREIDGKIYYRARERPMFEASADELIGVTTDD